MREMDNNSSRDSSIDFVGGWMILYMLFGHIISWTHLNNSVLYITLDRLFFFFMPWFFYKSGMYYKGQSAIEQWKSKKKLLYPFVFWGGLGILTYYLRNFDQLSLGRLVAAPIRTLVLSGSFEGNTALWFLFTLFLVKTIYPILLGFFKEKILVFFWLFISVVMIYVKEYFKLNYPEYIYNMTLGLLFYSLGQGMKDLQYKRTALVISFLSFLTIIIFRPSRIDFYHVRIIEGMAVLWVVASIGGIIIVNNIGRFLSSRPNRLFRLFCSIGQNSMTIYVSHFIVGNCIFFIMKVFDIIPENSWCLFSMYVLSLIIILPYICKAFQHKKIRMLVGK